MFKKKEYPVFLIKGFLEAGKTQFIKDAVITDGFHQRGDTLLFLLEEGIEEYPKKLLEENYTSIYTFEKEEDFTVENMEKVVNEIKPDRIIIEMNSMWNPIEKFPKSFVIVQTITFIDASTFKIYFNNMRQKFVDMISDFIKKNDGSNRIMRFIAVIFLLLFSTALCAEFGEYQYAKYLGIQQQLQNQRAMAIRRARMQQNNPMRNIRFPSGNNQYPNIQRGVYRRQLTPQQRYSARYYRSL